MRRPRPALALALAVVPSLALAGCVADAPEDAGYSPLLASEVRGLSAEDVESLRKGAGMGYAIPAEINGYPGPRHVLDLADDLDLTDRPREVVHGLWTDMNADARAQGERVIAAWRALEGAFANGTADADAVRALAAAYEAEEAALRARHLEAHLATADVLTHEQRARYMELRGYAGEHGGHGAHA